MQEIHHHVLQFVHGARKLSRQEQYWIKGELSKQEHKHRSCKASIDRSFPQIFLFAQSFLVARRLKISRIYNGKRRFLLPMPRKTPFKLLFDKLIKKRHLYEMGTYLTQGSILRGEGGTFPLNIWTRGNKIPFLPPNLWQKWTLSLSLRKMNIYFISLCLF